MISFLGKFFPLFARPASRREELTELLQESLDDKTSFDSHEGALLKNFLSLRDLTAVDVMIPRADIFAVSLNDNFDEIIQQMSAANHSRVPVYRHTLDDAVGIIHIKDLFAHLPAGNNPSIDQLLRPALFISPAIRLLDLLNEMRLRRRHLALVVDEFGGVDGLITIEDLVEQIVGEIEDEHDAEDEEELVFKKSDNSITVDASYRVEDLEEYFAINIPRNEDDETSSVGGLVYEKINRIPKNNEIIDFNDELRIKIIKSNNRKIEIVEVNKNN